MLEGRPKRCGVLREFLELSCVACCLGNTIFVHGALDPMTIGRVPLESTRFCTPSQPQPFRRVSGGAREWASQMNALIRCGLEDHKRHPNWDPSRGSRGGELLLALQNRASLSGRCVVSGAYADGGTITSAASARARQQISEVVASTTAHNALIYEGWTSDPADKDVAQWLLADGICRIVVGHKPCGDSPAVLSSKYTGVEVICADTSYADPTDPHGRGRSLAGVSLHGPSLDVNAARIFGLLADGRRHDATLPMLSTPEPGAACSVGGDPLVGLELEDGWWIKARLDDAHGAHDDPARPGATATARAHVYWCCRGQGRRLEYREERRPVCPG